MVFLLEERYKPLLYGIYHCFTKDIFWYEDCVHDLFIYLKGKNQDWHALATFEWRSSFGTWLKKVAWNSFQKSIIILIDNQKKSIHIDDLTSNKSHVLLSDQDEEIYERHQRKLLLFEAISLLKDDDQRFVILKRLQGYNSKEIAELLTSKWQKQGIQRYNNKKQLVLPDAGYVDVRTQRAKENLRRIIEKLTQ